MAKYIIDTNTCIEYFISRLVFKQEIEIILYSAPIVLG